MILCDSNVWLALALSQHSFHTAAFAPAGQYRIMTTAAAFRQFRGLDLLVLEQRGT